MSETPTEELVDPERMSAWLQQQSGDTSAVEVERLIAGHSNLTFTVRQSGREWILRRPPRGPLLPTAHDVIREYRVLSLLSGTAARVPDVAYVCEDDAVIGAPFYLMERVDGVVVRDAFPSWLGAADAQHDFAMDAVTALAELHSVDVTAFVESGLGKASGYIERQLRRWIGQREGVKDALASIGMTARELPDYEIVRDWLLAHQPPADGPAAIVHGDYKIDNVICTPDSTRIAAIVDWEMATVGDPLADLGYLLSFSMDTGSELEAIGREVYASPGYPNHDEIVDHYGSLTGRSMTDVSFYITLAVWKLAILLEGNYSRHLSGTADDPFYETLDAFVPALLARARQAAGI